MTIVLVSGSKGGVGKSVMSMAVLDALGPEAVLVETDTSNPDVAKAYQKTHEVVPLDLDRKDGWIELVNLAEARAGRVIVINSAARFITGLQHAPILIDALEELQRALVVLFMMSRSRDSLGLLAEHRERLPPPVAKTWAVLNGFFGPPAAFTLYEDSNQRKAVEATAGTLVLPDLADRVFDEMFRDRLSIAAAVETMIIGNRVELLRWRAETREELRRALGDLMT